MALFCFVFLTSQVLHFLEMDHEATGVLDFGGIAVYTCEASCATQASLSF